MATTRAVATRGPMDTDLIERARRGDESAFASLALEMHDRLHTVAHGILRDPDHAQDALQQALVATWRELPRLRDPQRFQAWTFRILVNICRTEARRARRWVPTVLPEDVSEPRAARDLEAVADRDQLERAFRRLSVDHRAVVVLHHYLGLRPPEIAEALGIPVGTVGSRLHQALRSLRAAIEADQRAPQAVQPREVA